MPAPNSSPVCPSVSMGDIIQGVGKHQSHEYTNTEFYDNNIFMAQTKYIYSIQYAVTVYAVEIPGILEMSR